VWHCLVQAVLGQRVTLLHCLCQAVAHCYPIFPCCEKCRLDESLDNLSAGRIQTLYVGNEIAYSMRIDQHETV